MEGSNLGPLPREHGVSVTGPPGKSLINDFKKHDIQKNTNMVSTEDWFQEMHLSSADTKIHRCSSPLYKMAVQSPLVSTGSAPLDSPPVDTQG